MNHHQPHHHLNKDTSWARPIGRLVDFRHDWSGPPYRCEVPDVGWFEILTFSL